MKNTPALDKARVLELLVSNPGANKRDLSKLLGLKGSDRITLKRIPPDKSLATMLLGGELDAAFVRPNRRTASTNLIERSQRIPVLGDWSRIAPAFGDGVEEGGRFFAKHSSAWGAPN